jgi:beta-lactam-binding protein with PASTA domain
MLGFTYQNLDDVFKIFELKLGTVIQQYSDDIEPGFIIQTIPPVGSTIIAGKPVDVIVSIGVDPLTIEDEPVEYNFPELPAYYRPPTNTNTNIKYLYDENVFYTDEDIFGD